MKSSAKRGHRAAFLAMILVIPCSLFAQRQSTFQLPHKNPLPPKTWHTKDMPGEGEVWEEDFDRIRRTETQQLSPARQLDALRRTGMLDVLNQRVALAPDKDLNQWTRLGPVGAFGSPPRNGRISGLQIMPDGPDNYQVFAGACQGGLWTMRTQAFAQWLDIGRNLPNPSVRAFAVDPDNYQRIIVGTGDFSRYIGAGMFETLDGGVTWQAASMPYYYDGNIPDHFFKVICLGDDPVTTIKRWVAAGDLGPLYSSNDGATWSCGRNTADMRTILDPFTDMVQHPGQPGWLWATRCDWDPNSTEYGIYFSDDYGQTWSRQNSPALPTDASWARATLAICTDYPDNMVVSVAGPDEVMLGLYRTVDGSATWTQIRAGGYGGDQAGHTLAVAIKPDDPDYIIFGNVNIYTSADGGSTWSGFNHPGHADITHLEFNPLSGPDILWICNDGGLYYNDLALYGTYDVLGDATTGLANSEIDFLDAKRLARGIGLQDNGIVVSENGGDSWHAIASGDGADYEIVDPATGKAFFITGVYDPAPAWRLHQYVPGGIGDLSYLGDLYNYMPRLYYSHFLDRIYANGDNDLLYSDSPPDHLWSLMLTDLQPEPYNAKAIYGNRGEDDALWVTYWNVDNTTSEGNEDLTYVYKDDGVWTTRHFEDFNLSGYEVLTVTMSREWPGEAWVGLNNPDDPDKIWHTTNGGIVFNDITGNLTSVASINTIEVMPFNPQTIFVGTNLGVYRTTDGGTTWAPFMDGLPIGRCAEMKFVEDAAMGTAHKLVLAMDGRGVWERDIDLPPLVYVDKRNTSGVEDGTFEYPFDTLPEGLAVAPPGATIVIHSDEYAEPELIDQDVLLVTWGGETLLH